MLPRKSQEGKVTQLQWGLALLCPYPSENWGGGGGGGACGLCPTFEEKGGCQGGFCLFPKNVLLK